MCTYHQFSLLSLFKGQMFLDCHQEEVLGPLIPPQTLPVEMINYQNNDVQKKRVKNDILDSETSPKTSLKKQTKSSNRIFLPLVNQYVPLLSLSGQNKQNPYLCMKSVLLKCKEYVQEDNLQVYHLVTDFNLVSLGQIWLVIFNFFAFMLARQFIPLFNTGYRGLITEKIVYKPCDMTANNTESMPSEFACTISQREENILQKHLIL